jgi:hypothetical protein
MPVSQLTWLVWIAYQVAGKNANPNRLTTGKSAGFFTENILLNYKKICKGLPNF